MNPSVTDVSGIKSMIKAFLFCFVKERNAPFAVEFYSKKGLS